MGGMVNGLEFMVGFGGFRGRCYGDGKEKKLDLILGKMFKNRFN